jgi:hypothetical protein
MDNQPNRWPILLAAIPVGMAVNLIPGLTAMAWQTPIFLDAIGTIAFTILFGWREGAAIGALSVLAGGIVNPHMPYFVFSQCAIAVITGVAAQHGDFKKIPAILATGLVMGIVAAVVSAPGVALAFGGAPKPGETAMAHFLSGTGEYLQQAFASKNFWVEPVDKILQCTAAAGTIKLLPKTFLHRIDSPASFLKANGFI